MDDAQWSTLMERFTAEAGDAFAKEPESWELCLLAKLASRALSLPKSRRLVRSLTACRLQVGAFAIEGYELP